MPRSFKSIAALAVSFSAVGLAGCGLSTVTSGLSGSVFGAKAQPATVNSITEEQLLSAAKADFAGGGVDVGTVAHGCPKFDLAPAQHQHTVYEPGQDGDALAVIHRGEITRTARECSVANGQVSVKYGFSGRVLLGPRGRAGRVNLPLHVFVADAQRTPLVTEDLSVEVDVSVEKPIGYFSVVRTVTFPVTLGSRPGDFNVFVGFKPQALGLGGAPRRS